MKTKRLLASLFLCSFAIAAAAAYPERPIKLIVPFGAGGVTDTAARVTAQALEKALGQPVVVENRPGAEGAIAAMSVKAAPPDGYTLLFATNSTLAAPLVSKAADFELSDFAPISTVGRFPYAFFVNAEIPAANVKDFVAHARAHPGKLNYATVNNGEYLAATQFSKATGVQMVRVPYKQAPVNDVVAGRVQVYFGPVGNGIAHVRDGRLRMIAMLAPERSPMAPEVPTISEAGVANIDVFSYQMYVAPAGTPRAIVDRLAAEIGAVLRNPEVRAQLERTGLAVEGMAPQQLRANLEHANRIWAQFFREAGIERQ